MKSVRIVLCAMLIGLLGACTSIPTSGPVHTSSPQAPERSAVDVIYSGPAADASPEAIVEGFLAASSSGYGDDFATARLFLTEEAATEWNPFARVDIIDASQPSSIAASSPTAITVAVTLAGEVDPHGRLSTKDQPVEVERHYELVADDAQQWRIAHLPDGLMMADVTFENHFDRIPLHFLSPDHRVLIPETRWFPRHTAVQSATQALLYGPSSWLAPAVDTAVPANTRLDSASEGPEGVASLDLSTPGTISDSQRGELLAQLQRTLRQIPAVQSLSVRINGTPTSAQNVAPISAPPSQPARALFAGPESLMQWSEGKLTNVAQTEGQWRHPVAPFPPAEGGIVAMNAAGAIVRLDGGQEGSELFPPGNLIAPVIDRLGWVYSGAEHSAGVLAATTDGENTREVQAPWLRGAKVVKLGIAPDGARALVLSDVGGTPLLQIAALTREEDGGPLALTDPVSLPLIRGRVIDASWMGSDEVAVLINPIGDGPARVVITGVGALLRTLPPIAGGAEIAAGSNDRFMVVVTESGNLRVRTGGGWREISDVHLQDPRYAG